MIDHAYKELYMLDNTEKQILLTFTGGSIDNTMLLKEEFELSESLCTSQQLFFGSCESAMLRFMVAEIVVPLKGKSLTVTETLNGDTATPFQFGKYKVDSDKPTANRVWREVIAYDALYEVLNADVASWYNGLTFPMTLKAFRDSFFSHFGITQETITLANDSMTVEETIAPEELSGKTVINAICEINGCFGHINRSGNFAYIILPTIESGLFPANDLYPADNLYPLEPSVPLRKVGSYKSCEYEDYKCQAITQLQIRQEENDIGAVVGTTGNTYIIEDNFLVYGKSAADLESIATNTLSVISGRPYRPFTLTGRGNPCTEVGDIVRIYSRSQVIESYVLQRTLKGIQALQDNFTATGEEYYSQEVNSVHNQIKQLKGKTNVLTRTVDETRSELTDLEESTSSRFTQTSESIDAEVTRAIGTEVELAASISVTASGLSSEITRAQGAESNLSNRINVTAEGLSAEIQRAGNAESELSNSISVTANGLYAEINRAQGVEGTLSNNLDITADGLITEINRATAAEGSLSNRIEANADGLSVEVTRAQEQEVALSGAISVVAGQVNQKVSYGDVIAQINIEATAQGSTAKLIADAISLEGYTTINGNFTVDAYGNVQMIDGTMEVVRVYGNDIVTLIIDDVAYVITVKQGNTITASMNLDHESIEFESSSIYAKFGRSEILYAVNGNEIFKVNSNGIFDAGTLLSSKYAAKNHNHSGTYAPANHGHNSTDVTEIRDTTSSTGNYDAIRFDNGSNDMRGATLRFVVDKIAAASDLRLKKNRKQIKDCTEKYMLLRPVQFEFRTKVKNGRKGICLGFLAQEVALIFPEGEYNLVSRNTEELTEEQRKLCPDGMLEINNNNFHALHTAMIQRHEKRINALEAQNTELMERLDALERMVMKHE